MLRHIVLEIIREPMFLLLVVCGAIYFMLGDRQEASMLLGLVVIVAVITLYQEHKTERALEALRDLSSPRALVVRDGKRVRIAGREVVRGEILVLSEGDRVPADAALVASTNFFTDESLLTGESASVRKTTWDGRALARPGGENLPFVYAGTLVTQGQGIGEVLAIGMQTEMGRIGKALQTVSPERSPLQRETSRLVRRLATIAVLLCVVVVIVYGFSRNDWLGAFLAGLTLAMAILPNEFPAVLAIFLALGAWRVSRKRALTRRVPVLETLGAATVLCVDKTGTLTLNQMSVRKLFTNNRFFDVGESPLPEFTHDVVEYAILASQRDPFDPMEKAIKALGELRLAGTEHLHPSWTLVRQYPLSDELLALSHVWKAPDGEDHVIAAKGAYEAIADLCHLPAEVEQSLHEKVHAMANDGLRVLGVACCRFRPGTLPSHQHDFPFEFVGLLGLADPVRPTVPAAIAECSKAGIRVVMITGDHPQTARSIARQIGLGAFQNVLTGAELEALDDEQLTKRIETTNIFARVVPEQKLRIVRALQKAGEVVAMTGDGVNDAPALKAADIGIAMGGRGTDVARESSSLVLLDDDFATIVEAVKVGRRIFDNLKNAMAYILGVHVPIAGMTVLPVLFGWPLVLLPVHIAFLHLIIEPACSIVFETEPESPDVMRRPPRDPRAPLFGKSLLAQSLLRGTSILVVLLAVFWLTLHRGRGEIEARGLTFATLIVANLGLIIVNRSQTRPLRETLRMPNPAFWWVIAGAVAFSVLVLYAPLLRGLFRIAILHFDDVGLCVAAGIIAVGWLQVVRLVVGRRPKRPIAAQDLRAS
jgi:Ca2+-transporting ATPase